MSASAVTPKLGPKEHFFRYFQQEVTALQVQMDKLADLPVVGGERTDAIDHCLAGIARLANEVKDASPYLPAYDQRTYSETIKALSERFQETRAAVQPKSKFAFKTVRKNRSAISLKDVAEIASAQRVKVTDYRENPYSTESSVVTTPAFIPTPPNEPSGEEAAAASNMLGPDVSGIQKPSFSDSKTVQLSNYSNAHIILPSSASRATSSGSLTSIKRCVVDMSVPTASGRPFAGLALKHIRDSLIVCGHVDGPAHITGVENSVIVVACKQFRMHDCKGVDVYLLCASRPIIEDCSRIRFAPMPEHYLLESEQPIPNQWEKVDDFKWLKAEHSPNWSILPEEKRIPAQGWKDIVPGGPGLGLNDILKAVLARQ